MSPTTKKGAARPPKAKTDVPVNVPQPALLGDRFFEVPPPRPKSRLKPSLPPRARFLGRGREPLPVLLSDDELLELGGRLAEIEDALALHQLDAKVVRKELREKESALKAERKHLAMLVRNKHEERDVEVENFLAEKAGHVDVVRTDTGQVVRTRPAKEGELQGKLPLTGEGVAS